MLMDAQWRDVIGKNHAQAHSLTLEVWYGSLWFWTNLEISLLDCNGKTEMRF